MYASLCAPRKRPWKWIVVVSDRLVANVYDTDIATICRLFLTDPCAETNITVGTNGKVYELEVVFIIQQTLPERCSGA